MLKKLSKNKTIYNFYINCNNNNFAYIPQLQLPYILITISIYIINYNLHTYTQ